MDDARVRAASRVPTRRRVGGGFLSSPLIRTPRKTNFCDFYCTLMLLWALTRALAHSLSGARERTTHDFRTESQRAPCSFAASLSSNAIRSSCVGGGVMRARCHDLSVSSPVTSRHQVRVAGSHVQPRRFASWMSCLVSSGCIVMRRHWLLSRHRLKLRERNWVVLQNQRRARGHQEQPRSRARARSAYGTHR